MKIILTGATGMVGEGVLNACLQNEEIEKVIVIGRKSCGIKNPKLQEIIHGNFYNINTIKNQLHGYDACFFCLGVSSFRMKKNKYFQKTYLLTMHVASILAEVNKNFIFCYVSGAGTNSAENGSSNWSNVKGKTENDLTRLPLKKAYHFRPGIIAPNKGARHTALLYKYLSPLLWLIKKVAKKSVCTLPEIANAMFYCVKNIPENNVLEVKNIKQISKLQNDATG